MNPTNAKPGAGDAGLAKASFLAGMPCEYNTPIIVVQRLQRLYRVSEAHAATIARLASLGPQEGR
jgi:hypothetical protein